MTSPLSRLFHPRSVALLGASDRTTWSKMAFANLKLLGFDGAVHLVSRSGASAHGQACATRVADIGAPVDVALLMLPNAALGDVLRDLGAAGVPFAIVLAGGFAETGTEGERLQQALVDSARGLGITLLGPNSLGFINFGSGAVCWTGAMRAPPLKGGIGIVSQSGAVSTVLMHFAHEHGIGLNLLAATGNEAMLDLSQVLDHLVDDPGTRVIAMFVESVRDPLRFRAAAARALHAGKPLVLLKVGRSDIARQAAQSHTGALVGDDAVFDGVCRQQGVLRVETLEELIFTAAVCERLGMPPALGLALLSASGGMGELAADRAEDEGLPIAPLAPATLAALSALLPPMATPGNPLDLTGAVVNNPDLFRQCMEVLQRDPAVHQLICIYDVPTALDGDWSPFAVGSLEAIGAFRPDGRARFLVVSHTVKYVAQKSREEIARAGLPYIACGLDIALRALRRLWQWSERHRAVAAAASGAPAASETSAASVRALSLPLQSPQSQVNAPAALPRSEREAMDFLGRHGVPVVPQILAVDADAAVAAARRLAGPVVLKIASPDIAHKSDLGGVLLDLQGDAAVAAGFARIMAAVAAAAPQARVEGVLVAPMRRGGLELFVGVRADAQWGPVLALGLGGVWIEALHDLSLRPLPVGAADVIDMLAELRGARLLRGWRGAAPVDIDRLAEVVARIGDAALALGPRLDTLEVNPLRADGARIEALDALVTGLP